MKKVILFISIVALVQASIFAQSAESHYSQAYNLSARGDKQGAIESYSKAIQLDKNYKKAYAERGILYSSLGENAKALDDFSKALDIDPKYDYARRNRAAIYMDQERYAEAVKDYDKLIQQDPQFSFYYDLRGMANYKIGNKEAALADFNKFLEYKPNNEDVQLKRAKLLLELGRDDEAYKSLLGDSFQKDKLDNEAKFHLAKSSRKVGEYKKSLTYLDELINAQYRLEPVYLEKGLCHLYLDEFSASIQAFDRCLKHNPSNEVAFVNKASAESQLGDFKSAVKTYTAIIEKWGKDHTRALNGRAIAYYGMNETKEACKDWESAVALGDKSAKDNHKNYCTEEQLQPESETQSKARTEAQPVEKTDESAKAREQIEEVEREEIKDIPEEDVQEQDIEEANEPSKKEKKKKKSKKEKVEE